MIKLKKKNECVGCEACVSICPKECISFIQDKEGFFYPKVDIDICIDCGLCNSVCPVINQSDERIPEKIYVAKNPNEEVREKSSSGGIFSMLAEDVILRGGVVFGARFTKTWSVVHDFTESLEGLAAFRGSKYVQSRIGDCFIKVKEFLEVGREVLFSGTPCQVAGLRLFLKREYDNLLLVDLICHGVPSPTVWERYLSEFKVRRKLDSIEDVFFRDKRKGWNQTGLRIVGNSKESIVDYFSGLHENEYTVGFISNLYLRPSCYKCPSRHLKSGSDFTIADFWGIEHELPNVSDNKGINMVLINSIRGDYVFERVIVDSIVLPFKYSIFSDNNQQLFKSFNEHKNRAKFFKEFINNKISLFKLIDRYIIYETTFIDKIIWNLKNRIFKL